MEIKPGGISAYHIKSAFIIDIRKAVDSENIKANLCIAEFLKVYYPQFFFNEIMAGVHSL